jgi:hypothetical protein
VVEASYIAATNKQPLIKNNIYFLFLKQPKGKLNHVEHPELEWGPYIAGSTAENRVEDICAGGVDATLRNI